MTPTEDRILKTISVVMLCSVVFCLGMLLDHRLVLHRIERVEAGKARVDGRTLDACSLGCRTEDDVVCGKFVDLVKRSR